MTKHQKVAVSKQSETQSLTRPMNQIPGLEGIDQGMLVIPRIKLVQKSSVEVDDGIAPGSIVNSVTKELITKKDKPIVLVPVLTNRTRLYFRPYGEGGGLQCRSLDGVTGLGDPGGACAYCPKNKWNDGKPPACSELINIFCMVRGYDFPIPLSVNFGKTSMGAGKQFVQLFYMQCIRSGKSPWYYAFKLSTEQQKNDKGTFHVFRIEPAGDSTTKEQSQGDLFYKMIKSTKVEVHEDEGEIVTEQKKQAKGKKDDPFED